MAITKQYTIEVRGEFEPEDDKLLRVAMQRLAREARGIAQSMAVLPHEASVCLYSDDFFIGHEEIR